MREITVKLEEMRKPPASIATQQIQLKTEGALPILKSIDALPAQESKLKFYARFAVEELSRDTTLTEKNVQELFQRKYPNQTCKFLTKENCNGLHLNIG